jgi:hypothetical protein
MPKHPTLEEVINERCSWEWITFDINGFFIGDFADADNGRGDVSSFNFSLFTDAAESEYGTVKFEKSVINISEEVDDNLQQLKGRAPLGSINYYETEQAHINITLNTRLYNSILNLLNNCIDNLEVKVAIPVWENSEAKVLPLLKYQVSYQKTKI